MLAKDMAIKAFFYGERIVQALVFDFNRLMTLDAHGRKRALKRLKDQETGNQRQFKVRPIPQSCKSGSRSCLNV